jgi:hypothetical protein
MSSVAAELPLPHSAARPKLDHAPGVVTVIVFVGTLAVGLAFTGYSLVALLTPNINETINYLPEAITESPTRLISSKVTFFPSKTNVFGPCLCNRF